MKLHARILMLIGMLFVLSGCQFTNEQQAEFDLEKAAHARLKLGLGYLEQAKALNQKSGEEINKAHYNLNLAKQYSPHNAHVLLGLALFDQHIGENSEAKLIYESIIAYEPFNGHFKIHYGTFLCATYDYKSAKIQFENAIKLDKSRWKSDALEQLGYCAIQNKDENEANKAFKELFKYDQAKREKVKQIADFYLKNGDKKIADYLTNIVNAKF